MNHVITVLAIVFGVVGTVVATCTAIYLFDRLVDKIKHSRLRGAFEISEKVFDWVLGAFLGALCLLLLVYVYAGTYEMIWNKPLFY